MTKLPRKNICARLFDFCVERDISSEESKTIFGICTSMLACEEMAVVSILKQENNSTSKENLQVEKPVVPQGNNETKEPTPTPTPTPAPIPVVEPQPDPVAFMAPVPKVEQKTVEPQEELSQDAIFDPENKIHDDILRRALRAAGLDLRQRIDREKCTAIKQTLIGKELSKMEVVIRQHTNPTPIFGNTSEPFV